MGCAGDYRHQRHDEGGAHDQNDEHKRRRACTIHGGQSAQLVLHTCHHSGLRIAVLPRVKRPAAYMARCSISGKPAAQGGSATRSAADVQFVIMCEDDDPDEYEMEAL